MRESMDISQCWQFWLGEAAGMGETVNLPHTVMLTPANCSGGRNYQGVCTYRKNVYISEGRVGMQITAEFSGAMGVTDLWVNGNKVVTHYCGYIPFHADITDFIRYGEDNELTLVLDNSDNEDVPPGKDQNSLDFTYDGGLYRCASLVFKENLYITDELLEQEAAGGGVYVWTEKQGDKRAEIYAKVHVRNTGETLKHFQINFAVYERLDGKDNVNWTLQKPVGEVHEECMVNSGGAEHFVLQLKIEDAKWWSPEEPNLYTGRVEVTEGNKVVDAVDVCCGIRDFTFTYDKNLIYNGIQRRLSGGNYHFTYPYVGNAVPDRLLRRDARKLKKLGMENIRSHYPMPDAFVDECNRLGMTLIVSNPGWQWFKEGIFTERLIQNMRQIVRWQRNNPSIVLWEPMPNESVVPQSVQQKLHDTVHEECPHGSCFTASDHGPTDVSYRMYDPGMLEPGMEGYNPTKRYGTRSDYPVWIREYNDAPDNWTDHNCAWRTPRGWGDYAQMRAVTRMLGQDSQCTGNNYIDVFNNKLICGYGIWPAIEHNRGYHINPCWGGFLDMFRIPKLTAYFMESQQDIEKVGCVLHIANWWTDISPVDVTVFSNAEKVRLYHDGELVDELEPEDAAVMHPPFVFRDVHNRFKGRDRSTLYAEAIYHGKVVGTVQVKTPGVPYQLQLEVDTEGIMPESRGDMLVVRCLVSDREGTVVPYTADRHPILFEIEGGMIVGDDSIGANPVYPEAGIAPVLIKPETEMVTVSASLFWQQGNMRTAIRSAKLEIKCVNYCVPLEK